MLPYQILKSLCDGRLFLEGLPEATVFDRSGLRVPENPKPLNEGQKLGHLYEDALGELLEASERYDLLERGLQIQRGRHETVGELDFLFRDSVSAKLIHLELAVKFYLALESPTGLLMPGPNARDNYYHKLERLRTHQLTLTRRFPELLPEPYQRAPIDVQHLVMGCVFDHVQAERLAQPEYLSPSVRRGLWVRQSEFQTHFPDCTTPLVIPKPLWPVEEVSASQLSPFNLDAPLSRCTLLKVSTEEKPVFITPDAYPKQ